MSTDYCFGSGFGWYLDDVCVYCFPDTDGDGIAERNDNCPFNPNPKRERIANTRDHEIGGQ